MEHGLHDLKEDQMFSDERARDLMDRIMELVGLTFFDGDGSFQCSGCWPSGKKDGLLHGVHAHRLVRKVHTVI
jgi:hypothetical protein